MIAWGFGLLVTRLVLLVQDDRAKIFHRRENSGPRANGDAFFAFVQGTPCIEPLAVGECGVEDCDDVAEFGTEARDGLWRQRDFGDENYGAAFLFLDDFFQQFNIDRCLPRACDSPQQKRTYTVTVTYT